ncbi:MAG: hypothetical protein K1X36_09210 [Pyrinomonadaceae bacterium]|nr:hypothetical protein [Pyrinomonadaceae bacterium]
MKYLVTIIIALSVATGVSYGQNRKDKIPCNAIQGKTYISWVAGKFDANPDAAGASRLSFNSQGSGTSRSFLGIKPTDTSGTQQMLKATCTQQTKGSYLQFSFNGTDAGGAFITSYDEGAKVWVEAATPGRPMKGWMLLLPPNPPSGDNIIK